MSQLAVVTFSDQVRIDNVIFTVHKLETDGCVKFHASAIVAKDADNKLSVQEITKESHGGTAIAALIGAIAGLPAGPAAAAIGATGGAVIGIAAELSTEDEFNEFANNIAESIAPGGAAIVADVADDDVTAFKAAMQSLGGTVLS